MLTHLENGRVDRAGKLLIIFLIQISETKVPKDPSHIDPGETEGQGGQSRGWRMEGSGAGDC